ncbi:Sodium/calcium exchanger protein-domain-containing protein [Corynascus novoguineensis]|uniref:Sodium/calcium exchanger protein-domain-containing protein n=1 Tax=Corynascus novoguineensis TaxID=1126955 RepID=A0AAN7D0T6_9PEZI|nr:Sodium/calcium exchanger protein-domain-containing protein [Corynascus novoguineensis]
MRRRFSARPAVAGILLVAAVAVLALFQSAPGLIGDTRARGRAVRNPRDIRQADADCRNVHNAADKCAFILANCEDDEAGLIHYLSFYYCSMRGAQPVAFAILALWLGLLFTTIGIAASDFFSVNLSTIASVLGLSESLAGVTFLAFGNGSPDVFSTFAAMGSNSGSMAVGELIGAAGFITAVVAGSMALVREFKVNRRPFVRDIVFFIVAVSFTMVFLADGELHLWECFTMIGFYLFYVAVVVGWHWFTARRRRQRMRDVAARAHLYSASAHGSDELEPYRDEPDEDEAAPVGGRSDGAPDSVDISALERAPRIEVDQVPPADEDEEQREIHVAAEMASSMRVNRPRWGRSNTTITPIRPSLLGVLEFRSVLSSLQKERNMHLAPLPPRAHSQQPATAGLGDPRGRPRNKTMPSQAPPRIERTLSYGNEPLNLDNAGLFHPGSSSSMPHTRTNSATRTVDGLLAPPAGPAIPAGQDAQSPKEPRQLLNLEIPSPSGRSSGQSSPSISPFPGLSESPAALTPHQEMAAFSFPAPVDSRHRSFPSLDDQQEQPKPIRWWPYSLLPAPHVFLATVFPTLQGWSEKSLWDKAVSLVSVPSVFLLVATLPVVETEAEDSDSESDMAVAPEPGHPGNTAPALVVEDGGAGIQPETEWQAYRQRARSASSRSPLSISPSSLSLDHSHLSPLTLPAPGAVAPPPIPLTPASSHPTTTDKLPLDAGWNRWLVAVQLFTGPLFVVLVVWASTAEDMVTPRRTLVRMVLYSLLVSLCLLAALLATTSSSQKPKYHFLLCFLGFIISVAWISTIAGEVVGVLKAFGVILDISEAILGLTVFAVGNSLGDLVADVTVARLGYPVMALAACFGGPMLNILLGVGIGGAWMGIRKAKKRQRKHPGSELRYKPYRIQVGGTLMISAVMLLLTLLVLLIAVPSNGWVMSRRIGWGLIGIWTVGTVVNLVVEMTGTLADVSVGVI